MILVINLNASVDKRYRMKELTKGEVMRAAEVENTPGGKGLHVANVATILGEDCIATGYLGGKSGEFIGEKLKDYGIKQDFVRVAGETRSCLAIITDDGAQTELLEPGPVVTAEEQEAFLLKYRELLSKASVVVARTVARRAERVMWDLAKNEIVPDQDRILLNRICYFCFMLMRLEEDR